MPYQFKSFAILFRSFDFAMLKIKSTEKMSFNKISFGKYKLAENSKALLEKLYGLQFCLRMCSLT